MCGHYCYDRLCFLYQLKYYIFLLKVLYSNLFLVVFSRALQFSHFFEENYSILAQCFLIHYVLYSFYLLNLKNIPNFIFPKTSEIESDDHWQREQELQRENLKLSSENIELKFQLEQANKDLPRLKVNLMFFIIVRKSNA